MITILTLALLATPPTPPPSLASMAVETRLGFLLPKQVHDGANLHLAFGWRWWLGWLALTAEAGLERSTLTGLSAQALTPYGAVHLRADAQLWSAPLLAGLALSWGHEGGEGHLDLLGGWAWSYRRLTTEVVNGDLLSDEAHASWSPLVRARLGWSVRWSRGALLLGGGWQHVFDDAPEVGLMALSTRGAFLEVGWRARF
ncbi:hypothetical protein KKB55_08475 [Myxococcota bacterium]|nr:hypothetical protein [Myxococcota bacterium]MBU1897775.1 hypothetical protein [Myxococcota bacterium]